MSRELTPAELEAAAQTLITARPTNLGIEVSMPVIYPNGEAVTVVVTVEGGEHIVHDAGFGAMQLTASGVKLTKRLSRRLANLASHYGCEFIANRTTRRCAVDQLALAMAMVANASRTIGDQALDIRQRADQSFVRSVKERIHAVAGVRVRDHHEVKGKSGRAYWMSHVILDPNQSRVVAYVKAVANDNSVLATVGEFFDIRGAHQAIGRASIYDDSHEWRATNLTLLREVSEPVRYSDSETWAKRVAATN